MRKWAAICMSPARRAIPQVTGGFDLLRGSLTLLGQRLVFTRGQVRFHGDVIPELDLVAETNAADITARIAVTGPATQPAFAITSQPSLPQDEILSRILFQRPSGSLSGFQALELANAVATLSGSFDAFEGLRKTLGVDSLDISTSATGGALVGVTRAINDRISVGVTTGARPWDNGVNVNLDVTRHLRLQAGVDASGGSSAGVGARMGIQIAARRHAEAGLRRRAWAGARASARETAPGLVGRRACDAPANPLTDPNETSSAAPRAPPSHLPHCRLNDLRTPTPPPDDARSARGGGACRAGAASRARGRRPALRDRGSRPALAALIEPGRSRRSDRAPVRARCRESSSAIRPSATTRSATTPRARSRGSCIAIPTGC